GGFGEEDGAVELVPVGALGVGLDRDPALKHATGLPVQGTLVDFAAAAMRRLMHDVGGVVDMLAAAPQVGAVPHGPAVLRGQQGARLVAREPPPGREQQVLVSTAAGEPGLGESQMKGGGPFVLQFHMAYRCALADLDVDDRIGPVGTLALSDVTLNQ